MRKKKELKLVFLFVLLALMLILCSCDAGKGKDGEDSELLLNGDFSVLQGQLPANWQTDAWYSDCIYTEFFVEQTDSGNCIHIVNHELNDARFKQKVKVQPNEIYLLHGYVRVDADEKMNGRGANLSIGGIYAFSESYFGHDAATEWHEISYYGRTGPEQKELEVFARLGGYGGESKGEAWFRDLSLKMVSSIPSDAYAALWYDPQTGIRTEQETPERNETATMTLLLCSGLYLLIAEFCVNVFRNRDTDLAYKKDKGFMILCGIVFALGIAARIFTASHVFGYDVDIGCFTSWMQTAREHGLTKFYDAAGFCDYPPGYIAVLRLFSVFGINSFTVKLPSVFFDTVTAIMILVYGSRLSSRRNAMGAVVLYMLNPVLILTGAAWGQSDSVMTALLLLCVLEAISGRWYTALPAYTLSVLMKPQALMFGPLGLIFLLIEVTRKANLQSREQKRKKLLEAGVGILLSFAIILVFMLVFRGNQDFDWLIRLYSKTMTSYPYATVNACNVYFLLGLNWVGVGQPVRLLSILLCTVIGVIPCVIALFRVKSSLGPDAYKNEKRNRRILLWMLLVMLSAGTLAVCLTVFGKLLSFSAFGTIETVLYVLLFCSIAVIKCDVKDLPLLGAGMLILLFNTETMMHERYLFPAVALLACAYLVRHDKRILWLMIGVSLSSLLNIGCVLDRNIRIGGFTAHLNGPLIGLDSDMKAVEYLAAVSNMISAVFALYLCLDTCILGNPPKEYDVLRKEKKVHSSPEQKDQDRINCLLKCSDSHSSRIVRKDALIITMVTAAYAVLALTNLGSMKAPQTGYISRSEHEKILFDLGENRSFKLLYYPGIQWQEEYAFSVRTGEDAEALSEPYEFTLHPGDCFHWSYVLGGYEMNGRYVMIDTGERNYGDVIGASLMELVCRDAVTNENIPMTLVTGPDGSEKLCDEPFTIDGEPSWWNSTYFDEIYHARTAYEHLNGLRTYETTHPPLGKVIMSWCISLFGMTPFGWRIAGAICGVLMLPAIYLLARLLTKKRKYAVGAILVFSFDLMHFTQTRIATIDSFVVLFILWSLYFMIYWMKQDYYGVRFGKTFIPLALSGLFMGLSIASKWTGCYNGAGLAVLFFVTVIRRFLQANSAARYIRSLGKTDALPDKVMKAAAHGKKMLLISVLSCLVFFVAVPALIYYLSYIPYFRYAGGVSLQRVIEAAEGMLSYHTIPGLGMDHFFYSPWYEWPLVIRPMWYYQNIFPANGMSSTIMCMGNPAVWWGGLLGLILVVAAAGYPLYNRITGHDPLQLTPLKDYGQDLRILILMFFAQFLPWMLVPRGTYIYHYFACVPVIILCIMKMMDMIEIAHDKQNAEMKEQRPNERNGKKADALLKKRGVIYWVLPLYVLVCFVLFVLFFPYASGIDVPIKWLDMMKWFPSWLWY